MSFEVDQSGKIGDTKVLTVLALTNDVSHTIAILANSKRACLHELRKRGKSGTRLYVDLFAVALFFLLRDHIARLPEVTIDVEYPGHSRTVKEHLLNLLHRAGESVSPERIAFRRIGKASPAHHKAIAVYRGQKEPDRIVSAEELLGEFRH